MTKKDYNPFWQPPAANGWHHTGRMGPLTQGPSQANRKASRKTTKMGHLSLAEALNRWRHNEKYF
jgi:phage gp16-like protein